MANICAKCGKGPQFGQNIRHVHSGSWALRAPRTKRRWLPNLQSAKVAGPDGETVKIRVCAKCLKKPGLVQKVQ